MLIHNILDRPDTDNIYFAEESYASLRSIAVTLDYLEKIKNDPEARISSIIDETGSLIGLVVFFHESEDNEQFYAVFTDFLASLSVKNNSGRLFSGIVKDIDPEKVFNTTIEKFNEAVIEYYSIELVNRHLCDNCHITKEPFNMVYIEARNEKLKKILDENKLRGKMLEICCGNGMSTVPLHKMGYDPVSIDYDKCQICQGLEHNALDPKRTIVLDATRLSEFFQDNSFDTIVGFMLGTIYPFNKNIWEKMMSEAARVLKPSGMILLTVNRKEEIEILKNALDNVGLDGKLIDNADDKGIYDQWIYVGNK